MVLVNVVRRHTHTWGQYRQRSANNLGPMRRMSTCLLLASLCFAMAGCGGGHKPSSALDDALGYFAKDAPLVAVLQTDPGSAQLRQLRSFGGGIGAGLLGSQIKKAVRVRFVDFGRDIRPQLGAPLVVGLARPAAGSGLGTVTIAAMRVKQPLRVKQVLLRQPNVRGGGKSSGVRIYDDQIDSRYFAVDGDMLVAAADRAILQQALALKRSDNRMREKDFSADLAGLPQNGLVRVSAGPGQMIGADARLRPALDVKWLASMRRLGAVLTAAKDGVALDFHLSTDAGRLSEADLPLAPRAGPLPLVGGAGDVQVGIRGPGRLARLAFAVWRAVAPQEAARFRSREPSGVDLEQQLPRHLGDRAVAALDPFAHTFQARADLDDAADVKSALVALAPALPDLAALLGIKGLGIGLPQPGDSFYALANTRGRMAVFGVVGNSLVAASDPARAAGLASEPSHPAPHGTRGQAVFTLSAGRFAEKLVASRLSGPAALFGPLVFGALRDLTGALTIKRSGLSGHAKLTIVK